MLKLHNWVLSKGVTWYSTYHLSCTPCFCSVFLWTPHSCLSPIPAWRMRVAHTCPRPRPSAAITQKKSRSTHPSQFKLDLRQNNTDTGKENENFTDGRDFGVCIICSWYMCICIQSVFLSLFIIHWSKDEYTLSSEANHLIFWNIKSL